MANGNEVTFVGHVARDPELRFTPSGQAVATFGIAVNRRWQNRQTQEWEESVSFFDIVCWQRLAENVADSVTKGMHLIVVARAEQRSWETEAGDKRSKVEFIADAVGPSLQWATAVVTKNPKEGGGSYDGAPHPGGADASRSRQAAPQQQSAPTYDYDEEPF